MSKRRAFSFVQLPFTRMALNDGPKRPSACVLNISSMKQGFMSAGASNVILTGFGRAGPVLRAGAPFFAGAAAAPAFFVANTICANSFRTVEVYG